MNIIWKDKYDKWICQLDRIDVNNGLLIVACEPGCEDFDPRGLIRVIHLAYGTIDTPNPSDVDHWKELAINFIEGREEFALMAQSFIE